MLVNWSDILDGELVSAAGAVFAMVAKPRPGRRAAGALDAAAWGDSGGLVRDALAEVAAGRRLPGLSEDEVAVLTDALGRHAVQGAVQALLAVRLTDSPETDAIRAREAVGLALAEGINAGIVPALQARLIADESATPPARLNARRLAERLAGPGSGLLEELEAGSDRAEPAELSDTDRILLLQHVSALATVRSLPKPVSGYLDDRICALVATLEGRVGFAELAQVRDEAYNARIVSVLGAIERQVAALAPAADRGEAEADFLERYRRQARARHGKLTPPDFDRRRLVTASEIYVATAITPEDDERRRPSPEAPDVWDLTRLLGRTVLLGDPGGGKTTAANMLAYYFAEGRDRRVPFLVTLRDYAAGGGQGGSGTHEPIGSSVVQYIEETLKALYQSPAPRGLVERLLLTGRAVVIFDGLDELLDTSRRRDVSERVELFCSAYPLTPVLVTSRLLGYDQARLDDTQFHCYRLGGFDDNQVAEYVGKWFTSQEAMPAAEAGAKAKAFLTESAAITDLRSNPLLLSLMCILYRGAGSLPADRAGIYAKCAELLLRKWDEHRDLYRKLDADHLVEPALGYLAWWLFTREDAQTAVTERELVTQTADFLHGRAYDTEDEALAAAREFVAFCRGRMWVFSDAGTTADGERLYGFTHRTFLEYFAACHLAAICDSPEDLAGRLALAEAGGLGVVGEIAVKVKSVAVDRGADRFYTAMLDRQAAQPDTEKGDSLSLLIFLADCLDSARPSPAATRRLLAMILDRTFHGPEEPFRGAYVLAMVFESAYQRLASEEAGACIAAMVAGEESDRIDALTLLCEFAGLRLVDNFDRWAREQATLYAADISRATAEVRPFRPIALDAGFVSTAQVLAMPGGLEALVADYDYRFVARLALIPVLMTVTDSEHYGRDRRQELAAIGDHLVTHPELPWIRSKADFWTPDFCIPDADRLGLALDERTGLGLAAACAIVIESATELPRALPDWPMSAEFKQVFRDWAEGKIDFVATLEE